jgi:Ion transport protein
VVADDIINSNQAKEAWYIIMPQNRPKLYWNFFMLILLIYYSIFVPFNTAFLNLEQTQPLFLYIGALQDLIFIFDMIICFFSAYVTETDEVISDFRTISKSYIKSWLIVDLFGCFPSDLITLMGVD